MYDINWDYWDVLELLTLLQGEEQPQAVRMLAALDLFYEGFGQMPTSCWQEAAKVMMRFINLGEDEGEEEHPPRPQRLDWDQDYPLIAAEVNKAAGCEVRMLPALHWWTFVGYFHNIGEGQLATVCSIREKRRRGKALESWEREYYAENKAKIDLKIRYNAEEEAERARLLMLLGEG